MEKGSEVMLESLGVFKWKLTIFFMSSSVSKTHKEVLEGLVFLFLLQVDLSDHAQISQMFKLHVKLVRQILEVSEDESLVKKRQFIVQVQAVFFCHSSEVLVLLLGLRLLRLVYSAQVRLGKLPHQLLQSRAVSDYFFALEEVFRNQIWLWVV